MTLGIQCAQCGTLKMKSVDIAGWPLYYFGAGPNNPQDAEVYFCDVYCANDYHKEKRDAKET